MSLFNGRDELKELGAKHAETLHQGLFLLGAGESQLEGDEIERTVEGFKEKLTALSERGI